MGYISKTLAVLIYSAVGLILILLFKNCWVWALAKRITIMKYNKIIYWKISQFQEKWWRMIRPISFSANFIFKKYSLHIKQLCQLSDATTSRCNFAQRTHLNTRTKTFTKVGDNNWRTQYDWPTVHCQLINA